MIGMLGVGVWASRRIEELEDYLVAGRALTLPLLVGTLLASYYCGMYFFADAGFIYSEGISGDIFYYPCYYFLMIFLTFFLMTKLRALGDYTLPDILDRFYGKVTRIFGAIGSFLYCIPVMQLMACGIIFNVLLGWPVWLGALFGGLVTALYTLMGGLWSVAVTDMIQFGLMFLGILIAIPVGLHSFGGWSNVLALNPEWHLDPMGGYFSWVVLGVYAASSLTLLVEPVFYQRFFAARDQKTAVRSLMTMVVFWMLIDRLVVSMGLISWAKFPGFIIPQDEVVFTTILKILPYGLTGLYLCGVLAGIMSTVSSYTLCGAANLSYDIIKKIFIPGMSEAKALKLTRYMVFITFAVSYGLGFIFPRIMLVWLIQASILTSVAVIPIVGAYLWPFRKSAYGGTLSAVVGFITTIAYIAAVFIFGEPLPGWDTIVWEVNILGYTIHLWAEMVIYVSIVTSLLAYIIGNHIGPPFDMKALQHGKKSC